MTCRQLTQFLDDYLSDALTPGERVAFEQHLAACRDCRRYLDSYRKTIQIAKAALLTPDEPVPKHVPEELVRAILDARRRGQWMA